MLNNKIVGAHLHNFDLNTHSPGHFARAVQEGIAFAFRYGLDIMRENGIKPKVIRAGKSNMFLSEVFTEVFVNSTGVPVELYESNGSIGAAIGAGMGANVYSSSKEAFQNIKKIKTVKPQEKSEYDELYDDWKKYLDRQLK
jgi:xylulokinase